MRHHIAKGKKIQKAGEKEGKKREEWTEGKGEREKEREQNPVFYYSSITTSSRYPLL